VSTHDRAPLLESALRLSYFTIVWNGVVGVAALAHLLQHGRPVHDRHGHVEHDEVEPLPCPAQCFEGLERISFFEANRLGQPVAFGIRPGSAGEFVDPLL
jgi:hypothetical protein